MGFLLAKTGFGQFCAFLTKKQALKIFFHLQYMKFGDFFVIGKTIFAHYF